LDTIIKIPAFNASFSIKKGHSIPKLSGNYLKTERGTRKKRRRGKEKRKNVGNKCMAENLAHIIYSTATR